MKEGISMLEKQGNFIVEDGTTSVYHFAQMIGKRPQQLFQSIGNGSMPMDLIVYKNKANGEKQPFVKVEEAKAYFATKDQIRDKKTVARIIEQPAMVADAFISMVEKDDPKLGKRVREWWNKKNAPTPETK